MNNGFFLTRDANKFQSKLIFYRLQSKPFQDLKNEMK